MGKEARAIFLALLESEHAQVGMLVGIPHGRGEGVARIATRRREGMQKMRGTDEGQGMKEHTDHIRQCLAIMRPITAVELAGAAAIEEELGAMEADSAALRALVVELVDSATRAAGWLPYHEPSHPDYEGARSDCGRLLREKIAKANEVLGL